MPENSSNSKRLAKNTVFLYVRLLFSMVVSLYTSRIILQYLGVEDYGIYNAVGGVVTMFSIISGSLSTSISRNLTYELGKRDKEQLHKVFSMSINIQLAIILVIVVLAETLGLWFLNAKMVIPADRISAANWVFQFALLTLSVNLISVPYNASIISHERMNVFAYIGILDVVLRLVVVYLLQWSPFDRLSYYAFLLFVVSLFIQIIYWSYCKKHFEECTYHKTYDKAVFKNLFGFATWNFIGSSSSVLRSQGINILLNIFFGPVTNAARAISTQVNNAINGFVGNFMVALTPQITKSYAQRDYSYLIQCVYRGAKFSYFLLLFLSLPVLIETDYILHLWLVEVPDTTVNFVRYTILYSLVDTLSRTLINANNATGDIKKYQIVIGTLNLTVLPIAYVLLKLGAPAESTVLVSVAVSLVGLFPRIYFNKKHIPITYKEYTSKVLVPTFFVTIISIAAPCILYLCMQPSIYRLIMVCVLCVISTSLVVFFVGCTKFEKEFTVNYIRNKIKSR